jgi:hypothetical protein
MARPVVGQSESQNANQWMSHPFIRNFNSAEKNLQSDAKRTFEKFDPNQRTAYQLDAIWKQLAYLNGLSQFQEARKTPGELNTYTVILNLFGNANSGAVDQILPANPRRKRVTLYASEGNAYVSNDFVQTINPPADFTPGGTASPLSVQQYFFLPSAERWPLETNTSIFAIGASKTSICVLSVVEELYNQPRVFDKNYLNDHKHEGNKVEHAVDWMEMDQAAVERRQQGAF